ncbi:hypothetical protein [Streptomyces sp. NBC_01012]|uniref:hypothetical protein n=1 Tax=Streptomyces sp. NBC_01012 TaxID=2903717 RepID=UPI0038678478
MQDDLAQTWEHAPDGDSDALGFPNEVLVILHVALAFRYGGLIHVFVVRSAGGEGHRALLDSCAPSPCPANTAAIVSADFSPAPVSTTTVVSSGAISPDEMK